MRPLWTYIHVLMLVHILTQVWDKMMGECNIQTELHRDTHVCMKLSKEDGADIELGRTQEGWVTGTHMGQCRVIHICVQLSNVCGADVGSKVDMHTCTDICKHSTQSVRPEKRYFAYACGPHRVTHVYM